MIFVDTSAFYAMVSIDDPNHEAALRTWSDLIERNERLVCNNYILVESIALAQRRVGMEAVAALHQNIIPFLEVEWLDENLHSSIMEIVVSSNRRAISLVDQASFNTMYRYKIKTAFSFDEHFREQGFDVIP